MIQAYKLALEAKNSNIFVEFCKKTNLSFSTVEKFIIVYPINF
jgi:hypothetical protein